MDRSDLRWELAATGRSRGRQGPRPARAPGLRALLARHRIVWATLLPLAAVLALLLAFRQVVLQAVQQGDARREAAASHAADTWRCNAQRDRLTREACQARLSAVTTLALLSTGRQPARPTAVASEDR